MNGLTTAEKDSVLAMDADSLMDKVERFILEHPGLMPSIHATMISLYLVLLIVPPLLPTPPEGATPFNNFVLFSNFVFFSIWWPFVLLTMLLLGRAWCGFFCPEGALSGYVSKYGGNRPVPKWMTFGGIPLLAFVGITVFGQLVGVDDYPASQLEVLGGSTVLALVFALIYTKRGWVWCRYLCPVSLLFGVFSRLGALHFKVDHGALARYDATHDSPEKKEPCPVFIYLPKLTTNRYCLMCFRCADWRGAIHLRLRKPGEEVVNINQREPLFWETVFLFGAIGLALGVFHWQVAPFFKEVYRQALGEWLWAKGFTFIMNSGPWYVMSNHPELGEVFNWLDFFAISSFILLAVGLSIGVLSGLTMFSGHLIRKYSPEGITYKEVYTRLGYLYTPVSLFSLFLGLSMPTFSYLASRGMSRALISDIRAGILSLGAVWSFYLCHKIIALQGVKGRRIMALAVLPNIAGILTVVFGWFLVFFVW